MGRKSREKQNRRMNSQKPANGTSETSLDIKKVTNSNSDDQESRNRSSEDIKAEGQTLSIEETKKIADQAEQLMSLVEESRKRTFENFFMPEDQNLSNLLTEELWEFNNHLKIENSNVFGMILGYVNWFEKNLSIHKYPNVKMLLNYVSKIEEFLILSTIENDLEDRDKAKTLVIHKEINDDEEITSNLGRVDGKNVENVDDCEDIQRQTPTMRKSTIEGKYEKYSNGICSNIREKEDFPHIMKLEFNDEALIKVIDETGENLEKEQDSSETKHTKENLNLCPPQKKGYEEITFLEFHCELRKQLRILCSKRKFYKEILINCRKLFDTIKREKNSYYLKKDLKINLDEKNKITAKEKVDQKNDRDLKIVEGEGYKKEKEFDSSTDCIQIPEQDTNEENRCLEDNNRPNHNIKYFNSSKELLNLAQETEDYAKRGYEKEPMNPKPSKKLEKQARQTGKIKKEKYNPTYMNMVQIVKEYVNYPEKDVLMANESNESHEATGEATNNEYQRSGEVSTTTEPVKDLNKNENIHFKFDSNSSRHIFTGNSYDYYSLKENKSILFNYKDENVKVQFTGNQIFISTEDNEFNIFIRKSNSVNLTEKATQTSAPFPNIK